MNQLRRVRGGRALGPALWAAAKARVLLWDRRARDPKEVQSKILASILKTAADTDFGWKHGYGNIRDYDQFRARVPLRTYGELEPWLLRVRAGERNVLWPGPLPYLARTAGSTAKKTKLKYLPVSTQQIEQQRGQAFDVLARYLDRSGDVDLPSGYALALLEPPIVEHDGRVRITSNPGLMQIHAPSFSRHLSLPGPEIHAIADYDAKIRAMADAYLKHDVRSIAGTTCWMTMLFDRVLERANKKTISEVWPNLRALFGGGVNAAVYRAAIDAKVGHRTWLMDTYNATEGGVFATSDQDDDAMLVIPDRGVFFEFVARDGTRRPLWEVEPGIDYSVALTTSSGLAGYLIGDVVRFRSVFPHRLAFRGRVDGELSIAQEMTSARQIEDAVRAAGGAPLEYAAAIAVDPDGTRLGGYVLFMEVGDASSSMTSCPSADAIDRALSSENALYGRYRNLGAFRPLELVVVPRGAIANATNRRGFQEKIPRIVDARTRDLLYHHVVKETRHRERSASGNQETSPRV